MSGNNYSRERILEQAAMLDDHVRSLQDTVDRAPVDRDYDFGVYMTDPCASADRFDHGYDTYVTGMESALQRARTRLADFVDEHSVELSGTGPEDWARYLEPADGWDADISAAPAGADRAPGVIDTAPESAAVRSVDQEPAVEPEGFGR